MPFAGFALGRELVSASEFANQHSCAIIAPHIRPLKALVPNGLQAQ
jgi:hypothetical protein